MLGINILKIKGFKAFPKEFELLLEGKHLLMYGENGSGKSSIYQALHCLFQSSLKADLGRKYFDVNSTENILNRHALPNASDAFVELSFADQAAYYKISQNGFETNAPHTDNRIKLLNGESVFINHKFLYHFASHRNSEEINLFPVFVKDIFPFTLNLSKSNVIEKLYKELIMVSPHPKGAAALKALDVKIIDFNAEIENLTNSINLHASDFHNEYFKSEEDPALEISLTYIEQLAYQFIEREDIDNGAKVMKKSTLRNFNSPQIYLDVKEVVDAATKIKIEKPHVYFNEAKLTAIALSIRFSILAQTPANGRFLALDDMLISLDMSNRTKVIDFLLEISNKFKIYLFTHDRYFYNLVKKKIHNEINGEKDWIIGALYTDALSTPHKPIFIKDKDKISIAETYLHKHDYPACGLYLRKECERLLETLFPSSLKLKTSNNNEGNLETVQLNLNDKILNLELFCEKENINYNQFESLKIYKDVLLNTLVHNDVKSPIFRNELKHICSALRQLEKVERRTVALKNNKEVSISLTNTATTKSVVVCIKNTDQLILLKIGDEQRLSYYGTCKVTKTIINNQDTVINQCYESIYDIYKYYCDSLGIEPISNLLDIIVDHGKTLREKLN